MVDLRQYEVFAKTQAFARHVDTAKRIYSEAASRGSTVISTSLGKDSAALCGIAVELGGRPNAFHMASPYSLPGYEETIAWLEKHCSYTVLPAKRSLEEYIEMCRAIGLPHERSRSTQSSVVSKLKRDPGALFVQEHSYQVLALGMRIAEKGPRAKVLRSKGPTYTKVSGVTVTNPLAYWTNQDVWAFIVSRGLPYNRRIYDAETHGLTRETIRNTGWLSTDGAHRGRLAWLKEHFPEQYRVLSTEFPQVLLQT